MISLLHGSVSSHDDERTEAQAATAGTARNAVSRPSVRAITFRPRRRHACIYAASQRGGREGPGRFSSPDEESEGQAG